MPLALAVSAGCGNRCERCGGADSISPWSCPTHRQPGWCRGLPECRCGWATSRGARHDERRPRRRGATPLVAAARRAAALADPDAAVLSRSGSTNSGCRPAGCSRSCEPRPKINGGSMSTCSPTVLRRMHGCCWLVVGANFGSSKLWLPERFAEVARHFQQRHGMRALVLVGPGEVELGERIAPAARRFASASRCCHSVLSGRLSLAAR